jgi:hypothetical protein
MQMILNLLISMFPPERKTAIRRKLVGGIEEIIDEHQQIDLPPNEIKPAREHAKLLVRAMIVVPRAAKGTSRRVDRSQSV